MFQPSRWGMVGACALLVSASAPTRAQNAERGNSCIVCHETIQGVGYIEHNFKDWEHSVHARAGVSCQACHGGNPAKSDKARAHAGLKRSPDPASPVYFTRIPATCGACHQAEYKAFQKSVHYRDLQQSGRGPNCVTCHGSMANHVLAPRDMEMTCALCHQKPTQASAAMIALTHCRTSLQRLQSTLVEAHAKHLDVTQQEREYNAVKDLHQRALEQWHTFDMAQAVKTSQEITRRVTTAVNEIHLKEQQKK